MQPSTIGATNRRIHLAVPPCSSNLFVLQYPAARMVYLADVIEQNMPGYVTSRLGPMLRAHHVPCVAHGVVPLATYRSPLQHKLADIRA
jgi:hypothetical protein